MERFSPLPNYTLPSQKISHHYTRQERFYPKLEKLGKFGIFMDNYPQKQCTSIDEILKKSLKSFRSSLISQKSPSNFSEGDFEKLWSKFELLSEKYLKNFKETLA